MNTQQSRHHSYTVLRKVGHGNFGQAFLVQSQLDSRQYIMKKISLSHRSKPSKQLLLQQINLMRRLNHPYVVCYHESFVQNKDLCILMEYAEGGDLEKYLQLRRQRGEYLTEQQAVSFMVQLLLGVKYIHEQMIVHRDLKAENIFLSAQREIRIGDFGISKAMLETYDLAKTKIGSPMVMAPQIWEGLKYNQKSDVWSLGCVFYKLLALKYPFEAENEGALIVKIYKKANKIPLGKYSQELIEMVDQMLNCDARKRPSVQKLLEKPIIKNRIAAVLSNSMDLQMDGRRAQPTPIQEFTLPETDPREQLLQKRVKEVREVREGREGREVKEGKEVKEVREVKEGKENMTNVPRPHFSKNGSPNNLQSSNPFSDSLIPLPRRTLSSMSIFSKCPKSPSGERVKLVEYRQNYPVLLEENSRLLKDMEKSKQGRQGLEAKTEALVKSLLEDPRTSKEDALREVNQLILNYLYP